MRDADYTLGNLECALSDLGQAYVGKNYAFRAAPAAIEVLKGRFDAMSVANNHSGDYGPAAFLDTLGRLENAGIRGFGGGANLAEAHAPLWIERQGLRIAVLTYDEFKPRSFEAGADLIVPFMHWGWEREAKPSARQRQLARRMIDAGADLVVGSHPHVTQTVEYHRGKLIVYSLGNFVFDGFAMPQARQGWLLRVTLDRRGVRGALTPCGKLRSTRTPGVNLCANP